MTSNIILQRSAYPGITSDRFAGTACTGTDKTTSRTLTVTNGTGIITVDRRMITPDDFSVSGDVITFNIPIDDRHIIGVYR